jgi:hypothetical protein
VISILATAALGVPMAHAFSGGNQPQETSRATGVSAVVKHPFFPIPNAPKHCRCAKVLPPFVGKLKPRIVGRRLALPTAAVLPSHS